MSEVTVPQDVAEAGMHDVAKAVPPTGEEGDIMSDQLSDALKELESFGAQIDIFTSKIDGAKVTVAEIDAAQPPQKWTVVDKAGTEYLLEKAIPEPGKEGPSYWVGGQKPTAEQGVEAVDAE